MFRLELHCKSALLIHKRPVQHHMSYQYLGAVNQTSRPTWGQMKHIQTTFRFAGGIEIRTADETEGEAEGMGSST